MKKPIIDQLDRDIIKSYYKESVIKGSFWLWNNKPLIVTKYEATKLFNDVEKDFIKSDLYKFIDKCLISLGKLLVSFKNKKPNNQPN